MEHSVESSVITVGELPAGVADEFIRGFQVQMALAQIEQARIGEATRRLGDARPIDGLGELTMRIQPDIYFRMRDKFGPDCWADKAFRESFRKKNPEAAVTSKSQKVSIIRP